MILIEPIRNGKWIKDGAYLIAIQYWAIENLDPEDTIVFPYICDAHVQIGYFQNPELEVNFDYLEANKLSIVRRDTGGGAIYIDDLAANFCFSFPYRKHPSLLSNYGELYAPIVEILQDLGAKNVNFSGKNDLIIDGKKVSGAAMSLNGNRIYAGYSLLYDIDFDSLEKILRPNRKKIEAKGITSVRQRVAKIKEYLKPEFANLNAFEFKDLILDKLEKKSLQSFQKYQLSDQDWSQIDDLIQKKYKNWDWTFGTSPAYSYNRDARLSIGTINFSFEIENFRISKVKISGDFFVKKSLESLEKALQGCKLEQNELQKALETIDLENLFFTKITAQEIIDVILS
ncbi:lipoate--protein ligase [Mesomycoplasma bovoculi]|uniref:lipoate--protein ligase n=1 Tax=Mesomycoplasma bovoculi M165/69 TaxID=743966 RepID=W5UU12_9BACT|nr:lipoate--protein ligase [Mesomycoplasma bovoculi]AHH45305.1 lipoate-protein ligase A [Mesomycoplasma bovoculi M165/69]